jgi:2,3-bisphosphoglycerate-independent phosphoglycerate mutase
MLTLIIMDGYGLASEVEGNAVLTAKKPNLDRLFAECPNTTLSASGLDVGLPDGQMGNSEVGHTNIGAGRVVYQELTRITKSIEDESFFDNPELRAAMENCMKNNAALHVMGLLSDGGVHSHTEHLYALLKLAKLHCLEKVYIHAFLDGRDTPPKSGLGFVKGLLEKTAEIGVGEVATVSGRYYAMDRDKRWERLEKAYKAMILGKSDKRFESPIEAVEASYAAGITDEFVAPTIITKNNRVTATIKEGDSVIFFNFRPDRARQITSSIVDPEFSGFKTKYAPTHFVCMTEYAAEMPNVHVAFRPETLFDTFGEYISKQGLRQLRIAETEKYAHVTFFFNGGTEETYDGEDRVLINSPKVPTYDVQPGMSAYELADEVCARIKSEKYDVVILNFANCDMVGHTGNFRATVMAVEAVDFCVGRVLNAIRGVNGIALITADHGNAEKMVDYVTKEKFTAHTSNPVPLILYGKNMLKLKPGKLCDIAPTMLELLGLKKPLVMSGESLICQD